MNLTFKEEIPFGMACWRCVYFRCYRKCFCTWYFLHDDEISTTAV